MALMHTTITFKLDGEVEIPILARDGGIIAIMGIRDNDFLSTFLERNKAVMGEILSEEMANLTLWVKG